VDTGIEYEAITVETDEGVSVITLNRPDRRNAYIPRMGFELNHAFTVIDSVDDVRAIVVTGAGAHFCVGADMSTGPDTFERRLMEHKQVDWEKDFPYLPPSTMATPIIGAINGDAIGVGLTLPLQWDIRVVASTARLSFAFTRRGAIPEANAHWLLPRLIGASLATELLLTGRIFSGEEAASMGLASHALEPDEVVPAAIGIARDIAVNVAPVSAALVKHLINKQLHESDRRAAFREEAALFRWAAKSPDAKEGVRSFLEKRPPDWSMSKSKDLPRDLM
jgi:enoyl-CoA hydratase/carnithine racemase